MSLAETLLADLSEEETNDIEIDELPQEPTRNEDSSQIHLSNITTVSDLESIKSIKSFCEVLPQIEGLIGRLEALQYFTDKQTDETKFLSDTNSIISDIQTTITILHSFLKIHYQAIWPNLESLIKNPVNYAQIIQVIQFDVSSLQNLIFLEKLSFLQKDEILSLTMSANLLSKTNESNQKLSPHACNLLLEASSLLIYIQSSRTMFQQYISQRATALCPNTTALVGPTLAAQLISTIGLENLCKTPACNLSSFGRNNSILGCVYYCDLVLSVSDDFKKQAVRQVCSKIVLAARVDYSYQGKSLENSLGLKWRKEIQDRLEKFMAPPENIRTKPLPKPVDKKSKKRGGRRFRKMKERMKMSEVEKAQNRMTFGEQEVSKMDAFGDEIGLGMLSKNGLRDISEAKGVQVSKKAKEKLDKFKQTASKKSSKLINLLNQDDRLFHLENSTQKTSWLDGKRKNENMDADITERKKSKR